MVVGLARSGVAAAEFLARRGASVVAADRKGEGELPAEALALREKGVRLELGAHRRETFTGASMVVVSPGVPWELPELEAARAAGVPVIAEIELAFRHLAGPRGRGHRARRASPRPPPPSARCCARPGCDVRVGGNIGAPLIGLVEGSTADTVFAVEVSSFQLEGTVRFHPQVAVWLNLSPDHLDRHPSLEAYVAAKARVFANQTAGGLGGGERGRSGGPGARPAARGARKLLCPRRPGEPLANGDGAFFAGGARAAAPRRPRGDALRRAPTCACPARTSPATCSWPAAAARLLGAPAGGDRPRRARLPRGRARARARGHDRRRRVLQRLQGHERRGRAPQPRGLRPAASLVILGGRYKGGDFADARARAARPRRGRVLAIGEARERVRAALGGVGAGRPRAVARARRSSAARALARPGDVVLLAPACSSFDMFRDYAERGRAFKDEVRRLAATEAVRG